MASDSLCPDKADLSLETLTLGYVDFTVINTKDSKQNPILAKIQASMTRVGLNLEYTDSVSAVTS